MTDLKSLKNIGTEMEKKLLSIDISDANTLKEIGSKEAFKKLKNIYPNVCLVHLYTLEGAILDLNYNDLPVEIKEDLKKYSETLK